MRFTLISRSAEDTQRLGSQLGEVAVGPVAILLRGDYGTGKTTFVQGLARGLGIQGAVRSPSYNILKIYRDGRLPLVHADLYRTHGAAEIEELGLFEELGEDGVLACEWPGAYQPGEWELACLSLSLTRRGDETQEWREIEADCPAECEGWAMEVLRAFAP